MVPCLFCRLHVYSHDVLRLVASAPERKQAWNSLDIYGGDWQSLSCETQWSASLQIFLLSSSSLSWALNLFPPLKKTALQFSIMFLFTFSWKEVKNSLIEGLFVSSEWSHRTQNSPLHSYAHSKSIAWSELTHFFFLFFSHTLHINCSFPTSTLSSPYSLPSCSDQFLLHFPLKKKEEDLLGISTEHA